MTGRPGLSILAPAGDGKEMEADLLSNYPRNNVLTRSVLHTQCHSRITGGPGGYMEIWLYSVKFVKKTYSYVYSMYVCMFCDTSDEADTLSLETMLSSLSNKR